MRSSFLSPLAALLLLAAHVACSGDDDYDLGATEPADADASSSSSGGSSSSSGASEQPEPWSDIAQCAECLTGACGQQLLTCAQDESCRDLLMCALQNNCFANPMACLQQCISLDDDTSGPSPERMEQLMTLVHIAQSCAPCMENCGDLLGSLGDLGSLGGASSGDAGASSGGTAP